MWAINFSHGWHCSSQVIFNQNSLSRWGAIYTDLQLSFNQHIIYLSRFYTLLWSGHNDNTGLVGEALTKYCWPNTPTPWGALVPPLNVTTLVPDSISHTQTFQSCPDVSLVNKIYQQIYVFIWTISKRTKRYDIKDSYKKWKSKWIFERGTYLYAYFELLTPQNILRKLVKPLK